LPVAQVMLQMGVVMLVAFIGAALASRLRLSVTIGYVVAGILIGPNISATLFGYNYTGLIQDTTFINQLSYFGLVLLLFFVGLQFPLSKLRATKDAAVILAVMNIGLSMFGGFVIGTYLDWPLIDTIFLAGVISMSSSAVTAKSLIDLKRLSNAETQFLISMAVLESFLAMFLLTAVNGLVVSNTPESVAPPVLLLCILSFVGFFAFLAAVVVPRTARFFEQIKSDELFILFALGLVFLAAALAEVMRVPAIIGAFFIGVSFANTKLAPKLEHKLTGFRDAFVAVFFLAFGMMIDPSALPRVLNIVLLAVPVIFLNDLFLTATLSYMIGFSGRAATAIGASMVGRNEEAILYASVGTRAVNSNPAISHAYGGELLNPFTGVLCIVMSTLAPLSMSRSNRLADFLGRHMPKSLVFGGDLVKRTLKNLVLPTYLPLYKRTKALMASLVAFTVLVIALIMTVGYLHIAVALLIPAVIFVCRAAARSAFAEPTKHTNYGLEHTPVHSDAILRFVVRIVVGAFLTIALVALLWQYIWQSTLLVLFAYFIGVIVSMKLVYNALVLRKMPLTVPVEVDSAMKPYRRGWRPISRTNNGRHR
jgi:CPA2 family monovalent cation:H+ antiporter-2